MRRFGGGCLVFAMLLMAGSVSPVSAQSGAVSVEAEGVAAVLNGNVSSARTQAIVNAQRNAVEQGVGLILDSNTVTENYELIKDKVLTSTQGFVTKYLVLSEGASPDRASYKVKIKASVAKGLLEDRLSALRILHKKMGNKRVMVVYFSENPNALQRTHGANRAALGAIRDELNRAGFRLFNEAATAQAYNRIERAARVDRAADDLIALALDQRADILVRFENIAGTRGAKGGAFSAAFTTIRLSAFDAASGRQIADAMVEGKQLLRANAGPYDWEKGLATAGEKAARQAATQAITRLTEYYRQIGDEGFNYLVIFKGFDDDQKDVILDFLENTPGFQNLSERANTIDFMEVELFSSEQASRLRRLIRAGMKKKGIALQTQSTQGNRIIFGNPKP